MNSRHAAAALITTTIALLIIFQLLSEVSLPRLEILYWRLGGGSLEHFETSQTYLSVPSVDTNFLNDGIHFLLGVGKADITGYWVS